MERVFIKHVSVNTLNQFAYQRGFDVAGPFGRVRRLMVAFIAIGDPILGPILDSLLKARLAQVFVEGGGAISIVLERVDMFFSK